ncbi:MAG: efflux RND transporter periplasmic adaptor subunit [Burkholderiales bacterium]
MHAHPTVPGGAVEPEPAQAPTAPAPATPPVAPSAKPRAANGAWWIAGVALAAVALAASVYGTPFSRHEQTTEDAYVNGNVVAVTAQVGGVVTSIGADDTDFVKAGTPLVTLDEVDAQLAVERAKAQLAKTVRQARAQVANAGLAVATVQMRQVELARASADLARRRQLLASGAIAGEDVQHAEQATRAAQAALAAAQQQQIASNAGVDRTSIPTQPDVMAAAAQLREAVIALARTDVRAPVSGVIGKRGVQLGQKIAPGVALMAVVPLDHLWVEANFKESQLRDIRIGQPVRLSADLYGGSIVYQGTVIGQQAGTGSAFSLLPAQNATGNWIKVTQRVPVRIALDAAQVAKHPLQLGLSMRVTVDTREQGAARLVAAGSLGHGLHTEFEVTPLARADDLVRSVIAANR